MSDASKVLQFHSEALPADTLLVTAIEGVEEVSNLFRFEVDLVSKKADIDLDAILEAPAALTMKVPVKVKEGGHAWHLQKWGGVLSVFRQEEKLFDWVHYHAVLVPRLWTLSLNVLTRIFMDATVREIIEDVLKQAGFTTQDYEFKCPAGPKREFVVQYQESDLDFINRWLEHEGIYYYFEQTDAGEKIIFGNSTKGYAPLKSEPRVPYRPQGDGEARVGEEEGGDWFKEETVQIFTAGQSPVQAQVILKDYNWRRPSEDLKVDATVVAKGVGRVYIYADHFKDAGEGKALARARAEEIKCRQKTFSGTSDQKSFRAGSTYQLTEHYRKSFNAEYLLTEVRHAARQSLGLPSSNSVGTAYSNEFVSIPATETFRPKRVTAWPSIHGVMHAKIDAGGSGQYAEVDDMGRYKVFLPFDLSGKSGGKASRFVRMAQPYAGAGMGMHFPLHKGTEVLLAFLDGDPDRPIIMGAVPNAETASPVTGGNATQCAIHTGGGNSIKIEDTDGSQSIKLHTPSGNTSISIGL